MKLFTEILKDDSGRYSLSKCILFMVAVSATIFMWKMVLLHEVTAEYFIAYLAFGTGHASLSKFLDKKKDENKP